ncbi:hypothetical protein STEG23_014601 [Scotinomys teguina]
MLCRAFFAAPSSFRGLDSFFVSQPSGPQFILHFAATALIPSSFRGRGSIFILQPRFHAVPSSLRGRGSIFVTRPRFLLRFAAIRASVHSSFCSHGRPRFHLRFAAAVPFSS